MLKATFLLETEEDQEILHLCLSGSNKLLPVNNRMIDDKNYSVLFDGYIEELPERGDTVDFPWLFVGKYSLGNLIIDDRHWKMSRSGKGIASVTYYVVEH